MARRTGRNSSGHLDPFYQRRRRFDAFFRAIGLHDAFAALNRPTQEFFWKLKFPDPILEFADTIPNTPANRPVRTEVEEAFRDATVDLPHGRLRIRECLGILSGLYAALNSMIIDTVSPTTIRFIEEARARVFQCYDERCRGAVAAWVAGMSKPLIHSSRLDTRLFSAEIGYLRRGDNKPIVRVVVSASEPRTMRAVLDGQPRIAYRAAANWNGNGLEWVSWNRAQLGHDGAGEVKDAEYPVYVQAHALRQLHRRVNLPTPAQVAESWLVESLREPRIVERQGADLLVEYRVTDLRLGYLVVTPADGALIVRTFKFLTMEGTPEARKLRARLGLTRREVDWLRLDELAAFTRSDLGFDDELRELFTECGCGPLFDLDDLDGDAAMPRGFASEVRRYLCLAA